MTPALLTEAKNAGYTDIDTYRQLLAYREEKLKNRPNLFKRN